MIVTFASHLSTRELDLLFLLWRQRGVIVLVTVPQILNLVPHYLVNLLYLVFGQCRVRQASQDRPVQAFYQSLDELVNGDLSVGCDFLFLEIQRIDAFFTIHGLTCRQKSVLLTLGDFLAFQTIFEDVLMLLFLQSLQFCIFAHSQCSVWHFTDLYLCHCVSVDYSLIFREESLELVVNDFLLNLSQGSGANKVTNQGSPRVG